MTKLQTGSVETKPTLAGDGVPFLHVVRGESETVVRGVHQANLGYRLDCVSSHRHDGIYVNWNWDGQRVTVTNDHLGLYPLFYYADQQQISLSPALECVLSSRVPVELDDEAVAVFLRLGTYLGEDTPFRRIKVLPPNAKLVWEGGRVKLDFALEMPEMERISSQAAMGRYAQLFRESIEMTADRTEPIVVPLSGGRDSRHILAELCRQDRKPTLAVTVDYSLEETKVAAKLAKHFKVPHKILESGSDSAVAEYEKNRLTNLSALEHGWMLPLAEFLRGRFDISYDGLGGDVLSAGLFLTRQRLEDYRAGRYNALIDSFFAARPNHQYVVNCLLSAEAADRFPVETAKNRIRRELEKFQNAPNPVSAFFLLNRSRRTVAMAPLGIQRSVRTVFFPYLHREISHFLLSLPGEYYLDQQFHENVIRHAYPGLNDIQYAGKTRVHRHGRLYRSFRYRRIAYDLLRYIRNRDRKKRLLNSSRLMMEIITALSTGRGSTINWGLCAVYLTQLEESCAADSNS